MNYSIQWVFLTVVIIAIFIILYVTIPNYNSQSWIYVGIIFVLIIIILYLVTIPVTVSFRCQDLYTKINYDTRYNRLQNNPN